jgi:ubiquinone/menaquinone biosynthesis C-methylase UbiE
MISENSATSYNKQPYRTFANRDSHPEKLATLARLMGVSAALPEEASVLEIGCGTGGNIIPMAERYPTARFVGIDISSGHIEVCQTMCRELKLDNVDFHCSDIAAFDGEPESFDYVICHGVYTWVPEQIQSAIMRVIGRVLKPEGVAYVSYNTLPGWYQRGVLRDVMKFGAQLVDSQEPMSQLSAGLHFMHLVAQNRQQDGDLYGAYLREGLQRLSQSEPSYVYHEYLEPCNKPVLFSEFVSQAQQYELVYLAEAKQAMHSYEDLTDEAKQFLAGFGGNLIGREQALDFFRNRMFRESLLCKKRDSLNRDLKGGVFRELVFSTEWRAVTSESPATPESSGDRLFREVVHGREMRLPSGGFTDLLEIVGGLGAAGGRFDHIRADMVAKNPAEHDEQMVMRALGMLWQGGFVDATCSPAPVETDYAAVARTSAYARRQALDNVAVTSLRHQSYILSAIERALLLAATGECHIKDLVAIVMSQQESAEALREEVENGLSRLVNLGFFHRT